MCLVAIAVGVSPRYPLIIAANRDEAFARPTKPLGWWSDVDAPDVLAGRDLNAGGTWFGINRAGRVALVTNVRAPEVVNPAAPSRGEIVLRWLRGEAIALERYAGVNVIAGSIDGELIHESNRTGLRTLLTPGIHGLSNATIDTPWPKVVALKDALAKTIAEAADTDTLRASLLNALRDDHLADDAGLPSTGVPHDIERRLSSAFIRMPNHAYGTRCSTILVVEAAHVSMFEATYDHDGNLIGDVLEHINER